MPHNPIVQSLDRNAIIEAALPLLAQGVSTDDIAKPYGITGRTLRNWLITSPNADQARAQFLADKLIESAEEIESAPDAFPLARAREKFKSYSWLAERRLPHLFGQKIEQNTGVSINVSINRQTRTIEHDDTSSVTDAHVSVDTVKLSSDADDGRGGDIPRQWG